MATRIRPGAFVRAALAGALVLVMPVAAGAHCDALDGPVVRAAQQALDSGDAARVLIWVRAADEPEIRAAFADARAVRALGPQARALADRFFFETVVRVHRAGEGEPYTGLKPAGIDPRPSVRAADEAIATGSLAAVEELLTARLRAHLRAAFHAAAARRTFAPEDVPAGREYVAAYVAFIHSVERLYEASAAPAHAPGHEGAPHH